MQTDPDPLWDSDPSEEQNQSQLGDRPSTTASHETVGRPRRRGLIHYLWKPRPIKQPTIDPALPKLPWPERCAEALRFTFLRAEHWLSRQGVLREWLRLNLWFGIALLAAAVLIVPPVTLLLEGVASWAGLVETTMSSVTATVMGLPPIVIAASSLLIGTKFLTTRWRRRKRHHRGYPDHHDPYD